MTRLARASIACLLGLLSGCELFEASSRSANQALWTQVSVRYVHQGVSKGPALITGPGGSLLEERRYEPFGEPVDATRDGAPVPTPSLELEPHNALNKPTDPRTGFSYHGARWMAPAVARWLSPDPAVKAPDKKLMVTPWDIHPYQYVAQNPTLFWDPDGNRKSFTPEERFFVETGMIEGHNKYLVEKKNPPKGWRGGCMWNFCNGIKWLFDKGQSCGGDVDASIAKLQREGRAGYTMAFGFQASGRSPRTLRPSNPGELYQRITQASGRQPGTYLFTIGVADSRHGQLLFVDRKANGQIDFTLHDQTNTKHRSAANERGASALLDSMLSHETKWVSDKKPDQRLHMQITEIYPEPEP